MMRLDNLLNFANPAAPKGLIRSAQDWVARRQLNFRQLTQAQPVAWCKTVFPGEEHLCPTIPAYGDTTGSDIFKPFRWTYSEPATLYYLRDCRILGDEGAVISPENRVFAEFSFPPNDCWSEHSCFRRRRMPRPLDLPGWYATLVYPASKFFYHWMVESLPRMALLDDYASILDGVFVPSPLQTFHIESLEALGIPRSKLIPVDAQTHYRPEHLFVPRAYAMYNPPAWMHRWYRTHFLRNTRNAAEGPRHRIYISRSDAPARRVGNEEQLVDLLDRFGFVTVRPTEHSFVEQAAIFNQADVIVAPHGAGLSNLVFCRPGTQLIEIFSSSWTPPCFMQLARLAGCKYSYVVADSPPPGHPAHGQLDDFTAPIGQVEEVLTRVFNA